METRESNKQPGHKRIRSNLDSYGDAGLALHGNTTRGHWKEDEELL